MKNSPRRQNLKANLKGRRFSRLSSGKKVVKATRLSKDRMSGDRLSMTSKPMVSQMLIPPKVKFQT